LHSRGYRFFLKWTLIIALSFPLSLLLLPRHFVFFVMAMLLWGVYYEFNAFSKFSFISKKVHKQEFSKIWGKLTSLSSLSYVIGPIIAINLLHKGHTVPMWVAASLTTSAILLFAVFAKKDRVLVKGNAQDYEHPNFVREVKVWGTLLKKVWPLVIFSISLQLVEAFFWSIGIIYADKLGHINPVGGYFVVAYIAPGILFSYLAGKLNTPVGKKRTSLILGFLAGAFLSTLFLIENIYLTLIVVIIAAVFNSLAYPFLYAVFEDYISRLGNFANDYMGIEQAATSVSYIIGPILGGFLATILGEPTAFSLAGAGLAIISVAVYVIIPRKIKMPQKELLLIRSV
jgi:hypothetical protein